MMGLSATLPGKLVWFVGECVIPLFILFNIVGWFDLLKGHADGSADALAFWKAISAAWFAGLVAALVMLWAVFSFCPDLTQKDYPTLTGLAIIGSGTIGLLIGIRRVFLVKPDRVLNLPAIKQRQILGNLVLGTVAVSATCAVLYYTSAPWLRNIIASAYAFMFVGYATGHVLEGKK